MPASRRKTVDGSAQIAGQKRKAVSPAESMPTAIYKIEEDDKVVESGFSDYNPFQSGDDDSPGSHGKSGKKRRRASHIPSSSKVSLDHHDDSRGGGSRRQSSVAQARSNVSEIKPKISMSSSKSVPNLAKFQAGSPFESLQTAPEQFRLIARQAEEDRKLKPSSPYKSRNRESLASNGATNGRSVQGDVSRRSSARDTSEAVEEDAQSDASDSIQVMPSIATSPQRRSPPKQVEERAVLATEPKAVQKPSKHEHSLARPAPTFTLRKAIALGLPLLAMLAAYGRFWALEKQALGFCDTGMTGNAAVLSQRRSLVHAKSITGTKDVDALLHDARLRLTPATCAPCPAHAICSDGLVQRCTKDFLLQPNKLAYLLDDGTDASQSVLPLLLPPRCRPDTERLVYIAETASQAARYLREHRGNIICSGEERARLRAANKDRTGQPEAWSVYGVSQDFLRKIAQEQRNVGLSPTAIAPIPNDCLTRQPRIPLAAFDDILNEAISDLAKHNEIVQGLDATGEPWLAAVAADMPLRCRARRAALKSAEQNKLVLTLSSSLVLFALYARSRAARQRHITEQVDELVPIALQVLQAQEVNHQIDAASTPNSFLAPAQLRDLVLANTHSVSRRAELWRRVEKIVEANSNVRATVAEQHGEEMRVWQWVGSAFSYIEDESEAGATNTERRRRSYGGVAGPRPSLSRPGTPRLSLPNRHITWSRDLGSLPSATTMPP